MAGVVAARVCCPVDVSVDGLDQSPDGVLAVCAIALRTKSVKRRQFAAWGDLEDRAEALAPAKVRRAIEAPIGGQRQRPVGGSAVCSIEAMQRGQRGR